jgi:hypothetical protein
MRSHDSKIRPAPQFGQRSRNARHSRTAARFQDVGMLEYKECASRSAFRCRHRSEIGLYRLSGESTR